MHISATKVVVLSERFFILLVSVQLTNMCKRVTSQRNTSCGPNFTVMIIETRKIMIIVVAVLIFLFLSK